MGSAFSVSLWSSPIQRAVKALQLGDVAVVDFDVTRTVDGGDEVRVPGAARAATQLDTAIAKHTCNQVGFDACNFAMQVMGGMGYSQDSLVEYCMRRCRGWMIAGGSIEILKNRIAEGVFERSFSQRPQA
jgi:alkylation response protein AidB-like acyl-CoA dehydrogenase